MRTHQNRNNGISALDERECYKLSKGIVSMRTKLANWTRLAVVVVAMAGTQTGCKSGWKMPGSDMFPWSKKPTESSLANSSPGLSMPSNSPTSQMGPAYKNSPSPLVSNAANPNRPTSPYGATNTTGPSFNMPPNNPLANSQMANNGAGVSASSNGYATGPYNMAATQNKTGFTPSSGYGAPTGYGASTGYGAPAGYGAPPPSSPQSPTGYGGPSPSSALAGMQSQLPPAYGGTPAGIPQSTNNSSYTPMGSGGIPAMPAGYGGGANIAMQGQSSMPNALPSSYSPSSLPPGPTSGPAVATQTYSGAAPYRPGSVGRQTGYDFSTPGAGSGLPPSGVPNTANSLPNGSPGSVYR